jgi:hypothetical protein
LGITPSLNIEVGVFYLEFSYEDCHKNLPIWFFETPEGFSTLDVHLSVSKTPGFNNPDMVGIHLRDQPIVGFEIVCMDYTFGADLTLDI